MGSGLESRKKGTVYFLRNEKVKLSPFSQDPILCPHLLLQPPNWLGDVIMAQPAMRTFIAASEPARVSVWGRPWLADVLPFLNLPDAQYETSLPRGADMAVLFPNSFRSAWMAWGARSKRRIGFRGQWRRCLLTDAPAPRISLKTQHHRDYYLDLAEQMNMNIREREVRLSCPEKEILAGEKSLLQKNLNPKMLVAIAPGAQFGGAKRYPTESWIHVAQWLSEQGYHILLLGTPAERGIGAQITSRCTGPAWNASGETTLRQALQLLAASRILLSNDSGLMHVAAGMQKPVVAIFGATDPARTAPSGSCVRLLYHPADCSPCLQRECSVPGQPCMGNVLPEEVRDACLSILNAC